MQRYVQGLLEEFLDGTMFVGWGVAPRDAAVPYVVLTEVSGLSEQSIEGPAGHISGSLQVDVYGRSYAEAHTIAETIERELDGHFGGPIMGMFLASRGDRDAGPDLDELVFRRGMDFDVVWRRVP